MNKNNKNRTIPKPLRELVWRKYNGSSLETNCPICYINKISAFNFEAGHIEARAKGGDISINNLKPICGQCNKSMGSIHMDDYYNIINKDRFIDEQKEEPELIKNNLHTLYQIPKQDNNINNINIHKLKPILYM